MAQPIKLAPSFALPLDVVTEATQTPAHEDAPKPVQIGDTLLWAAPEFEVRKR